MGIQIGAKPDSGFDDPIGMLKDCHRRIEHFLHLLCVVAERARGRELTAEETEAVEAALNYFRVGGTRHTADEEESLFPRLRAQGAPGAEDECSELEHDHERAARLHELVESLYKKWLAQKRLTAEEEHQLSAATVELGHLYSQHIEKEEQIVFPYAAKVLSGAAVRSMGEEFRVRRS